MRTAPCVGRCGRTIAFGREVLADCPPGIWPHKGRGHCPRCYWRASRDGTLIDFEKRIHSRREFAAWMGKTYTAFDRMWWRARAAVDPRATELGEKVSA